MLRHIGGRRSGLDLTRHGKKRALALRHRRLALEPLEERRLLDATGPSILLHTPTEVRNDVFDHIDLTFDEAIDPASFTVDDLTIDGPDGAVVPASVTQRAADTFRVSFPALAVRGAYEAVVGPEITDLDANPMDQNGDGTNGDAATDFYSAPFVCVDATTIFTSSITIGEGDATYDGEDILVDGATVTIDGPHSFNSVHLVNGAVLTHSANTITETHKLDLTVSEQVVVDSTSRIDVSGKGYPGGPPGIAGPTGYSGGSYGGLGAPGGDGGPNQVYGDYTNPDEPGSKSGGGLVRITADTLALDGQLLSNGSDSSNGGGSGGGIFVSLSTFQGTGSIRAGGGNVPYLYSGGGGSGGRIAVYASDFLGFSIDSITAPGGDYIYGGKPGGAGSVYIRDTDEPHGTLIIADGDGITPMGLPGEDVVAIADRLVIREATVLPEHAGQRLQLENTLTIEENGHMEHAGELLLPDGGVTVTSYGELHVGGSLTVQGPLSAGDHGGIEVGGDLTCLLGATIVGGAGLQVAGTLTASEQLAIDGGILTGTWIEAPSVVITLYSLESQPPLAFLQGVCVRPALDQIFIRRTLLKGEARWGSTCRDVLAG